MISQKLNVISFVTIIFIILNTSGPVSGNNVIGCHNALLKDMENIFTASYQDIKNHFDENDVYQMHALTILFWDLNKHEYTVQPLQFCFNWAHGYYLDLVTVNPKENECRDALSEDMATIMTADYHTIKAVIESVEDGYQFNPLTILFWDLNKHEYTIHPLQFCFNWAHGYYLHLVRENPRENECIDALSEDMATIMTADYHSIKAFIENVVDGYQFNPLTRRFWSQNKDEYTISASDYCKNWANRNYDSYVNDDEMECRRILSEDMVTILTADYNIIKTTFEALDKNELNPLTRIFWNLNRYAFTISPILFCIYYDEDYLP